MLNYKDDIFYGWLNKVIMWAINLLDCLQQPRPKIQDPFILWVALQAKGSIPIFGLLQQQDPKDNPFCKWVSRRDDIQIWVMPLLTPKMGLPYRYSIGDYMYCAGDPFWVWVPQWVSCWRQPKTNFVLSTNKLFFKLIAVSSFYTMFV